MNKGKNKRKAIQAERKKQKKAGTWRPVHNDYIGTQWASLFEFQRTVIGHIFVPDKSAHAPIKCKIEVFEDT